MSQRDDQQAAIQDEINRARAPRGKEILGKVLTLLGGSRMRVECQDGKERICRIPGKIRRRIWVREGDYVIVTPWEINGDKNADVSWRYSRIQVDYLKHKGIIKI